MSMIQIEETKWASLPWQKIDVSSENEPSTGEDNDKNNDGEDNNNINKNHYDDENADPSELYDVISGSTSNKLKKGKKRRFRDANDDFVEGSNDPGIFVGLEVIDGSQYHIEKVDKGDGFIHRLVVKGEEEKIQSSTTPIPEPEPKPSSKPTPKKEKIKEKDTNANKRKSESPSETEIEEPTKKKKKKNKKKKKKKSQNNNNNAEEAKKEDNVTTEQMDSIRNSWSVATGGTYLHSAICSSLFKLNFTTPTPIQASTLSASILGRRDIVGAAPTGSGKTLSYLLPILQFLMEQEDEPLLGDFAADEELNIGTRIRSVYNLTALILCPTRELALQVSGEFANLLKAAPMDSKYDGIKCGTIVGGLAEQKQKRVLDQKRPPVIVGTPGRLWELMSSKEHDHITNLGYLRFLVIDEADRMISQGNFPQLTKIFAEIQKSDELKSPVYDNVVEDDSDSDDDDRMKGLPGIRGEAKVVMLSDLPDQSELDENKGVDYEEESSVDDNDMEGKEDGDSEEEEDEEEEPICRQTFVYSATLTLPPTSFSKKNNKNKKSRSSNSKGKAAAVDGAIAEILERAGAVGQTKIVNLATSSLIGNERAKNDKDAPSPQDGPTVQLPPGLTLHEIQCTQRHKDSHLYAYLATTKEGSSGPCLVFCNSIGAVKRVGETLKVLGLPVRTLHAQMQQKARFSALESLKNSNSRTVVVATDVAARGLDISSVATVVHYDVSRAVDTFVHRAGRTARGVGENAVGCSISLVAAAEERDHSKICQAVRGSTFKNLDTLPLDGRLLSASQLRVNLASKIVECESSESRTRKNNQWFIDAAEEAGMSLDESLLDEGMLGGNKRERQRFLEAKKARQELKVLLAKPMRKQSFGKFLSAGISDAIRTEAEVKPYVVKENQSRNSKNKQRNIKNRRK